MKDYSTHIPVYMPNTICANCGDAVSVVVDTDRKSIVRIIPCQRCIDHHLPSLKHNMERLKNEIYKENEEIEIAKCQREYSTAEKRLIELITELSDKNLLDQITFPPDFNLNKFLLKSLKDIMDN
jgi:hypothetical protein